MSLERVASLKLTKSTNALPEILCFERVVMNLNKVFGYRVNLGGFRVQSCIQNPVKMELFAKTVNGFKLLTIC